MRSDKQQAMKTGNTATRSDGRTVSLPHEDFDRDATSDYFHYKMTHSVVCSHPKFVHYSFNDNDIVSLDKEQG